MVFKPWLLICYIDLGINNNATSSIIQSDGTVVARNHADVIVFEYLDTSGKKKGSKKQRLHLWRKQEIQKRVEHKAHILGIRIRRICTWNTSRFAYDGSGKVERGMYYQNGEKKYNYSICIFQNGKQYHCDLNASYNIDARYFVRELLKSDSVRERLPNQTKDSGYSTGTTRPYLR